MLDNADRLVGILPWSAVHAAKDSAEDEVQEFMITSMSLAYPDEILAG